jgi:hypothetical protein
MNLEFLPEALAEFAEAALFPGRAIPGQLRQLGEPEWVRKSRLSNGNSGIQYQA